ncbi:hypothetical protein FA95DRAFT_1601172 [Auriscalpium vulgare]|uniref:Uncharacterized protein n=1 Tax=Auriscalpium vulgare TaxID=40419 RepID=A0ACB8S9G4_9AGAM|nr:hypothetical protein FA95DRAFT_1601172 [Auriscalpium vulgare]
MQASSSPVSESSSDDREYDTVWLHTARHIITQIKEVHYPSPNTIHATLESVDLAKRALNAAQAAHRARLEEEEDAIEAAKEDLRDAYAVEDEAMDAVRRALNEQRNSLLPVARLPPEILRTVFTFFSEIERPWIPRSWHTTYASSSGWVGVTYVCQRWRVIALEHSGLWVHVPLTMGPMWAKEFAKRAQKLPLAVDSFPSFARHRRINLEPWQSEFVAKNMWRTERLDADVSFEDSAVVRAFSVCAPLLRALHLEIQDAARFPADFLGGHAPALRDLDVSAHHFPVPWTVSVFAHLTSLCASDLFFGGKTDPLDKFLDALEGMRELERLNMTFQILSGALADNRQHRRITLAKLAYLELKSYPRGLMALISQLSMPANAVVCYDVQHPRNENRLDDFFPVALASVYCHADSAAQSSNAVTSLRVGSAAVTVWTDADTQDPALTMRFGYDAEYITFNGLVSAHLRELTIDYSIFDSDNPWPEALRRMSTLQRLSVKGDVAVSVCADLASIPPILPALVTLVLVGVRIPIKQGKGGAAGETMWLLPQSLVARAEAGCRLEELDVMRCQVGSVWLARVREAIPGMRVTWDEERVENFDEWQTIWRDVEWLKK